MSERVCRTSGCTGSMIGQHHAAQYCASCQTKRSEAKAKRSTPDLPNGVQLTKAEYEELVRKASFGEAAAKVSDVKTIENQEIRKVLEDAKIPFLTENPKRILTELIRVLGADKVIPHVHPMRDDPVYSGWYVSDQARRLEERLRAENPGAFPEAAPATGLI